ncbi:MAG: hypothetical protein V9H25_23615 [Candidatus Competibacter sp.]
MNAEIRNSQQDVCRILSMALLSDNDLDQPEIAELVEMRVHEKLGITPEQFRSTLHDLCDEILRDDDRSAGVSATDPGQAVEMMSIINRDAPMSYEAVSRLVDLVYAADPAVLAEKLLDEERINNALDRVDDPQLQLWTCSMLLRLVHADGELHDNEKILLNHIFNRWEISPEELLDEGLVEG